MAKKKVAPRKKRTVQGSDLSPMQLYQKTLARMDDWQQMVIDGSITPRQRDEMIRGAMRSIGKRVGPNAMADLNQHWGAIKGVTGSSGTTVAAASGLPAAASSAPGAAAGLRRRIFPGGTAESLAGAQERAARSVKRIMIPNAIGFGGTPADQAGLAGVEDAVKAGNVGSAKGIARQAQKAGRTKSIATKGAITAALAAMILPKIFGSGQEPGLDPQVQAMLMQQGGMGGGMDESRQTGRTLSNMGKLLTMIRTLQGMGGLANAGNQQSGLI